MSNPEMQKLLAKCNKLLTENVSFAETLQWIALAAFVAAILLLVINALRPAKSPVGQPRGISGLSIINPIDWVKTVAALTDSLTKAPAPVILIALGLLLVWLPNPEPGESCLNAHKAQLELKAAEANAKAAKNELPKAAPKSVTTSKSATETKTTAVWVEKTKVTG